MRGLTACGALIGLLGVPFVVSACGSMPPPARSSGASLSDDGVLLAVVGQSCNQSNRGAPTNATLMNETIDVEVGNPARMPVVVHSNRFLLFVSARTSVRPTATDAGDTLSVDPGTTARFKLAFVAAGSCKQELRLASSDAMELGGYPIQVSSVRFVPE